MRTEFLCVSVLRVALGPRVKLASCKSALNPPPPPPVVYSTDRSKAVVPMLVLLFVALWFILRGDLFCHFVLVFFSPFSIAINSLWEERANLSAFRTFVRFVLVWSVSSSSWGLGRAAVCDRGTHWTFLLHFFFFFFATVIKLRIWIQNNGQLTLMKKNLFHNVATRQRHGCSKEKLCR